MPKIWTPKTRQPTIAKLVQVPGFGHWLYELLPSSACVSPSVILYVVPTFWRFLSVRTLSPFLSLSLSIALSLHISLLFPSSVNGADESTANIRLRINSVQFRSLQKRLAGCSERDRAGRKRKILRERGREHEGEEERDGYAREREEGVNGKITGGIMVGEPARG